MSVETLGEKLPGGEPQAASESLLEAGTGAIQDAVEPLFGDPEAAGELGQCRPLATELPDNPGAPKAGIGWNGGLCITHEQVYTTN